MQDKRDDYEPIIATRRSREPLREETQPLWGVVLAIVGALVVIGLLAWWWLSRSSDGDASTVPPDGSAPTSQTDVEPEIVEQAIAPPARDAEPEGVAAPAPAPSPSTDVDAAATTQQAPAVESASEVVTPEAVEVPAIETPAEETQTPAAPTQVSVKLMSPDAQVQFDLRGVSDASLSLTSNAGEAISLQPGRYRVKASGPQLQAFEQELLVDGDRPMEYTVELCALRPREREELVGRVVEERACESTAQCQTMFNVLSEYADELVRDRDFRTQQCARWREKSVPDGSWTLNINCGGATLATTCRIEIAEGACTFAEPLRSARGTACPRVELN